MDAFALLLVMALCVIVLFLLDRKTRNDKSAQRKNRNAR
jgi:hypothetical protein